MNGSTDILVRDSQGNPIAAVEIKNRRPLTPEAAITLRRNLIAHGLLPAAPYFMVVSQDIGYLWLERAGDSANPLAPPRLAFPMSPVIDRYLLERDLGESIGGAGLELLVLQWLLDLSSLPQSAASEPEQALDATGLLDALRGATVEAEAAA